MKEIQLTRGFVALVDDSDYDWLIQWSWRAKKGKHTWYAERGLRNGDSKIYSMHRLILNITSDTIFTDHIDGNGLNNQRYNIRIATPSQNNYNRIGNVKSTSGYKGVHWNSESNKWKASIVFQNRTIPLGRYRSLMEAVDAYDNAARKYFGEFARLNFPDYLDNG